MNDLISREKLIEDIDTVFFGFIVDDNSSTRNKLLEFINNQPTAYDVDDILGRLEGIVEDRLHMMDWRGQSVAEGCMEIVKGAVKE